MENQISLIQIIKTMESLNVVDGDVAPIVENLIAARDKLLECSNAMNELTVKGRDVLDILLGCMLATEKITG